MKIIKITRIILIAFAILSIFFHVGIILELGVNIKYNVTWFPSEVLDSYFRYLNLHFLFLLMLVVYLMWELVKDNKDKGSFGSSRNNNISDESNKVYPTEPDKT